MKTNKLKQEIKKNKYKYIFLITIIILGIIFGIIISNILSYNDKLELSDTINNYFINIKNNTKLNYISNLINYLSINLFYLILIFIFSLSIIGIIINPFILFFKSFIIGFSLGIMINIYSYKGIILGIFSIFPHQIINIIIYLLVSYYGIKLSINLFNLIFLKKQFNFSLYIKKYLIIIALSSLILVITALYETFLSDSILKLFTFLIN